MKPLKLAIVQEYVPNYRVPFFAALMHRLAEVDIDLIVIAGNPSGSQAARGDGATSHTWLRQAAAVRFRVGSSGPEIHSYGTSWRWRDCDGVVHGLRGSSIDLTRDICTKRISGRRVGVWGHIGRTVKTPNPIDVMIERWQMRHCDHVFGYTRECADQAVTIGIPQGGVTAVMNSIDVDALLNAYRSLDSHAVDQLVSQHRLTPGKVFGFIGGLDAPKRIGFLVEVLDLMWRMDPSIKVLVGGTGEDQKLLAHASDRGQVIMLGYVGPETKAMIMRVSQALVNPGRIGLVAVDALAVGIPILTTSWSFHAPEFDYLVKGRDVHESNNEAVDFAQLVLQFSSSEGCLPDHTGRDYPSIDAMADNFAVGVKKLFS